RTSGRRDSGSRARCPPSCGRARAGRNQSGRRWGQRDERGPPRAAPAGRAPVSFCQLSLGSPNSVVSYIDCGAGPSEPASRSEGNGGFALHFFGLIPIHQEADGGGVWEPRGSEEGRVDLDHFPREAGERRRIVLFVFAVFAVTSAAEDAGRDIHLVHDLVSVLWREFQYVDVEALSRNQVQGVLLRGQRGGRFRP